MIDHSLLVLADQDLPRADRLAGSMRAASPKRSLHARLLFARALAAALLLGTGVTLARDTTTLTHANFVEMGDLVTEVLDTSTFAFATMLIDSVATPQAHALNASLRRAAGAAVQRSEHGCPGGGSVKVGLHDADGNGELSATDRVVSVFEACVIGANSISGISDFVVAAHRYRGFVEVLELDFRFRDFGTAQSRWTGPAHAVLHTDHQRGTEHQTLSYQDLVVVHGPRTTRWNLVLDMARPPLGSMVASVDGTMTIGALRLQLNQGEPFVVASDGFPRSGLLMARDDAGARLEIEAGRRRYAYRLFRADNRGETADSKSQSKPYAGPR
jgi:hypothetical protein